MSQCNECGRPSPFGITLCPMCESLEENRKIKKRNKMLKDRIKKMKRGSKDWDEE